MDTWGDKNHNWRGGKVLENFMFLRPGRKKVLVDVAVENVIPKILI